MSRYPDNSLASPRGSSTFMQKLTNSHVSMRLSERVLQELEQGMQVAEGSSGNLLNYQLPQQLPGTLLPVLQCLTNGYSSSWSMHTT
jgi:hypothetical protein